MKPTTIVVFIFLLLILGCGKLGSGKRSASKFNPYRGNLAELLPPELSSGYLKFKLTGSATADPVHGATAAQVFTYMQEAGGIGVRIDGRLQNYASAADANAALVAIAEKFPGTLSAKGSGQRLAAEDKSLAWTNGSLLCIVKGSVAKGATNFEDAAPF